jgi:hypothetical protein
VFHHADIAGFVAKPTRAQTVLSDFLGDVRPDYWVRSWSRGRSATPNGGLTYK